MKRLSVFLKANENLRKVYHRIALDYYSHEDDGHGMSHIDEVIEKGLIIFDKMKKPKYTEQMVFVGCLYHDTGNLYDRKLHHEYSGKIVKKDKDLKNIFTDDELHLISCACEEHRASYNGSFTSELSILINDADTMSGLDIAPMIHRSFKYTTKKNPGMSNIDIYKTVYSHLVEKFGDEGYASIHLDESKKIVESMDFKDYLRSEGKFKKKYISVTKVRL